MVATQGLGAAIVTQIGGTPQFNGWFIYVLLIFVIITLVVEIIYLNVGLGIEAVWFCVQDTDPLCRKPSIC